LAQIVYSSEALEDFERIIDFLLNASPGAVGDAVSQIRDAISILERHPSVGRRVDSVRRELVITHGASGYLALYRHEPRSNIVRILRIRHQREAGYRD
jgi:plasmid stabilization system protein ParE